MKIVTRIALGFGTLAVVGIAIAVFGALKMRGLSSDLNELANDRMVKVAQFTELKDNFNAIGRFTRNIIISHDRAFQDGEQKKISELRAANSELLKQLEKTVLLPKGRELLKIINDNRGAYNDALDRAIALAEKNNDAEASATLIGEGRTLQNIVFKATEDSRALQKQIAEKLALEASQASGAATALLAGLGLLMLVIGAVVGWWIARDLSHALGAEPDELSHLAGRVAEGDLTVQLHVRKGDTVSVMAAMARMNTSLVGVVSTVREGAESVSTASSQISEGNNDLSQRTEEQASALEETAASMEELSSTVKQNADSTKQANQLAQSASAVAEQGGEVVARVVDTMKGINDSSKKISDIISVIDGIAFQTNILALNAAVEAARAGEQGRGFAVVASEVRNLAQRSASAAKEIKILIDNSVSQVEQGTSLVASAGSTMTEVVGSIRRVTAIMGEISAANSEQSQGVMQIGEAIQQMDQVTQQNAALVEEMAAAASSLRNQAQELVGTVAVFKLGAQGHQDPANAARPAPRASAEVRGLQHATNVSRPSLTAAPAKTEPKKRTPHQPVSLPAQKTGNDDWTSF